MREKKSNNAEVDFVISKANQIIPIEVKAGKSGSLKSLLQFVYHKNLDFAVRFDLNMPSLQTVSHAIKISSKEKSVRVNYKLLTLLYLIEKLHQFLSAD